MTEVLINQAAVEAAIVSEAVIEASIVSQPIVEVIVGGAASAGSIVVAEDGTQIVASAAAIDFMGAGVSVTDAGSGVAAVTIPGPTAPILVEGAGGILDHDPTGFDPGAAHFRLAVGTYPDINQPASPRNDTVYGFGYNIADGNGRANPDEPAFGLVWENYYVQGGVHAVEWHQTFWGLDNEERRFISGFFPRAGAGAGSRLSLRTDTVDFVDWQGNPRIQFRLEAGSRSINFNDAAKLLFGTNNVHVAVQLNAAGDAFVPLPYLNASDQILLQRGALIVSAVPGQTILDLSHSAVTDGTKMINQDLPGSSGSVYALHHVGRASGGSLLLLQSNADATNAKAELQLKTVYGHSGCDLFVSFENYGVGGTATQWTAGIDQSAVAFKISNATTLGTNDRLTIDTTTVAFGLPPKLPSYTVAGAPSASAAGAGAMIFATDETGGAVPAFSDGSDWRRVTDRAVIS